MPQAKEVPEEERAYLESLVDPCPVRLVNTFQQV